MALRLRVDEILGAMDAVLNRNLWDKSLRRYYWINPYWKIEAFILDVTDSSNDDPDTGNNRETSEKGFMANIKIVPRDFGASSFRIICDLNPRLNPSTQITYQAILPDDSEIFNIIASGQLQKLLASLENGTASLTDRDEEGRSLLHVSYL